MALSTYKGHVKPVSLPSYTIPGQASSFKQLTSILCIFFHKKLTIALLASVERKE